MTLENLRVRFSLSRLRVNGLTELTAPEVTGAYLNSREALARVGRSATPSESIPCRGLRESALYAAIEVDPTGGSHQVRLFGTVNDNRRRTSVQGQRTLHTCGCHPHLLVLS